MLRKSNKPVILVVNKVDNQNMSDNIYEFYNLGLGDPYPISSVNLLGLGDLLDEMVKYFPEGSDTLEEEEHDDRCRIDSDHPEQTSPQLFQVIPEGHFTCLRHFLSTRYPS
jgi:predicted GTPase